MMISYAQNREDVMLQRVFPDHKGFYVDVGANDPVQDSVTKHFSLRGWRGINIEPHPDLHRKICEDRPDDINLNIGASNRDATLEFLECVSNLGLSTFSTAMADKLRRRDGMEYVSRFVPVQTLSAVFEEHARETIDFLKIDAEAHEYEVISGNDWTRWRPRIVLVEVTNPELWEPILLEAGYISAAFDGINLYYVRREDPELLAPLMAPMDQFDARVRYWSPRSLKDHKARAEYFQHHFARLEAELAQDRSELARVESEWAQCRSERAGVESELARVESEWAQCRSERAGVESELTQCRSELARVESELAQDRSELDRYREISPTALRIARKLHGQAKRHPRLARIYRRLAGRGNSST